MTSVVDRAASRALLTRLFGPVPELTYDERAPHEAGFAAVFARAIAPELRDLERRRRLTLAAAGILIALAAAVAIFSLINISERWIVLHPKIFWIAAGVLVALAGACAISFRNQEERIFLTGMCGHFDFAKLDVAVNRKTDGVGAGPFKAAGLMAVMAPKTGWLGNQVNSELIKYDDLFTATHRGIGLWMVEVEDMEENKRNDSETVVWMGTLIELRLPRAVPWSLHFGTDGGGDWLPTIPTPDGTTVPAIIDPTAPTLLTGDVPRRLREVYGAFAPLNGKGEVSGDAIRISMELRGKARPFQAPGVFTSVYQCEPMIRLTLKQIACVFDLMDAVADALGPPAEASRA